MGVGGYVVGVRFGFGGCVSTRFGCVRVVGGCGEVRLDGWVEGVFCLPGGCGCLAVYWMCGCGCSVGWFVACVEVGGGL